MNRALANPIAIRSLIENALVFLVYGVAVGIVTILLSKFHIDFGHFAQIITEPLSFYTFMALSMIGVLGLVAANVTIAKTAHDMYRSCIVRNIFVPAANAGFATGAIVVGMMVGLALGLCSSFCLSRTIPNVPHLICVLFGMSALVMVLLYPMVLVSGQLFVISKRDEIGSSIATALYCIILLVTFYFVDKIAFWLSVCGAVILGVALTLYVCKRTRGLANNSMQRTRCARR